MRVWVGVVLGSMQSDYESSRLRVPGPDMNPSICISCACDALEIKELQVRS